MKIIDALKHPVWFKLKTERKQLIKNLPADTVANVFVACLEYLETQTLPEEMTEIDRLAFYAFFPDLEEAWATYEKRVSNGRSGGRPKTERFKQNHMVKTKPNGTEEDVDGEEEEEGEERRKKTDQPTAGGSGGLAGWPDLDSVLSFSAECGAGEDMARTFYDLNTGRNWSINGNPIRDWKKLFRSWFEHEKKKEPPKRGGVFFTDEDIERNMKYCL